MTVLDFPEITALITNGDTPEDMVEALKNEGVDVQIAPQLSSNKDIG